MNKCPHCGREFEGEFCPECGNSLSNKRLCPNCKALIPSDSKSCPKCGSSLLNKRLCPNCKALVPSGSKFCNACGFTLTPQIQSPVKGQNYAQIQAHKRLLVWGSVALVVALILAIAIPLAIINRHNGTYYLYDYENEKYNYGTYFTFKGTTYTDETGYSCDLKFDGNNVEMYAELLGFKDVAAHGTIEGDVLKIEILGVQMSYVKDGHTHTLEDKVAKEPTCEEEGSIVASCICGFHAKESKPIPALGHDFANNQRCTRCGTVNGALLEYALNKEKTAYTVTGIGEWKDTVVIIPEKYKELPVTAIGNRAFSYCHSLTLITIPDSVTSIGENAFYDCDGLTSITISDSVISIGEGAFEDCDGLTSNGHVHRLNNKVIKEATCEEDGSGITSCICGYRAQKSIPALGHSFGENYLCKRCGMGNGALLEFKLNADESAYIVKGIGEWKDTVVIIPDKHKGLPVTSIGDDAFSQCHRLTSITIPDSVTSIGENAFYYCDELTSITIPNSVSSIGSGAFQACFRLASVTLSNNITSIEAVTFCGCRNLTSIDIPDSVTYIGYSAFAYSSRLTSITIPNSVTSIGEWAFEDSRLTSITIPDSVTSIGERAFYDCFGLKKAYFKNPSGWKADETALSGLEDPEKAAKYLRTTYTSVSWTRSKA